MPASAGRASYRCDVLRLYDTATREVRELAMRDPGKVSIYLCGPTVYAPPHLGHGRQNIVYDIMRPARMTAVQRASEAKPANRAAAGGRVASFHRVMLRSVVR